MKIAITTFVLLLTQSITAMAFGQDTPRPITWMQLSMITFEEMYDENTGTFYDQPVFPPMIKALEGKLVSIKGYVIPMDVELNYYVVSAYPFSSCFFCGGAGPESVIDLQMKDKTLEFENDQRVTFCGKLRLNTGTFFELPFILKEAEICDD